MKKLSIIASFILTFALLGCTIPEDHFSEDKKYKVVLIQHLCTTLQAHTDIYEAYKESSEEGTQTYFLKIFEEECIFFPQPVLAKLIKLEFKGSFLDSVKVEVWKIILDQNPDEGEEIKYFWTAIDKGKDKEPNKSLGTKV
tara:strand:- start:313 stop:735 length:423 start_codon:yes stop_codon:yes gene_type:complete